MPLVETLTRHWRAVLIAIGAKFVETSTFFSSPPSPSRIWWAWAIRAFRR